MGKELAKVGTFTALAKLGEGTMDIQSVININMGGSKIDPGMLDRVKVPSGGSLSWEVPDIEGETTPKKELIGVIVGVQNVRSYYATEYTGGNEPPDCSSSDGIHGGGDPGGNCSECPLARFGPNGERPPCSGRKLVLLLLEDGALPIVVNVPPTSMRELDKYLLRLSSKTLVFFQVVTALKLVKERNSGGIEYARIAPSFVRALNEDEATAAYGMYTSLAAVFGKVAKEESESSDVPY